MALIPGTRIGPYEILAPIGAGGMGDVYRARDTKLRRDVAIKTLLEDSLRTDEQVARFRREAELLAALHHANVATVYGLEEHDGQLFIAMELIEGETLAERIARGPIPLKEALPLFVQIASGLEAAHEKGIIHRDLKPANIKISEGDQVKILDFGLAKTFAKDGGTPDSSQSPTVTRGTSLGAIMGTAAYMSPEQARGKSLDRRTDIWSFGCVLYEALTGKQTFSGETVSDVIAAILEKEPNWNAIPERVPSSMRQLLRRCLEKDPRCRLQHIGDARIEIEESQRQPPPRQQARTPSRLGSVIAVGVFLAGLAIGALSRPTSTESTGRSVVRLTAELPPHQALTWWGDPSIAISPDGRQLAYVGGLGADRRIYVRTMEELQSRPIADTDGAFTAFFSPEADWLGFYGRGKLEKVRLDGRRVVLCDAPDPHGASWSSRDEIVFAPNSQSGLWKISVRGGSALPASALDEARDEVSHRWPQVLPDGRAVLFSIVTGKGSQRIGLLSLETGKHRVLLEGGSFARYVSTGHLVYLSEGILVASPFDLESLEPTGVAVPLLEEARSNSPTGSAHFDFSLNGTFAFVPGGRTAERSLVWVDRRGAAQLVTDKRRAYEDPRLSPDGRKVAVSIKEEGTHIWVYDIERDALMPVTSGLEADQAPLWMPDSEAIVFRRGLTSNLFRVSADGGTLPERLTTGGFSQWPASSSSDGKTLVYWEESLASGVDVWLLRMDRERKAEPFLQSAANEHTAALSPDGRFLAYVSDESGRAEIYVRPFSGPGEKVQISNEGGLQPVWARDGHEISYRNGDRMMVVAVSTGPLFRAEKPAVLFAGQFSYPQYRFPQYDVSPSGERFIMVQEEFQTRIDVVLNWFEELKKRVPPAPR